VSPDYEDVVARWWAAVVGVAAYWLLGEDSMAESLYAGVELLPECLQQQQDPLARTVRAAFRAKRAASAFASSRQGSFASVIRLCDIASRQLDDSLTYWSCRQPPQIVLVSGQPKRVSTHNSPK